MLSKERLNKNVASNKVQRSFKRIKPKKGDIDNSQLGGFYYEPVTICITGYKGSGKTLVANMMSYIISVNNTKKGFKEFSAYYDDKNNRINLNKTIVNFGDFVKHSIGNLFGIPVHLMYNSYYKEETGIRLIDNLLMSMSSDLNAEFENFEVVNNSNIVYELSDLRKNGFIAVCPDTKKLVVVRLRTLMQYHGDKMKECYGKSVFSKRGRIRIKNILNQYGYAIVADCRYPEEIDASKGLTKRTYIINIDRESAKPLGKPEHSSEEYY